MASVHNGFTAMHADAATASGRFSAPAGRSRRSLVAVLVLGALVLVAANRLAIGSEPGGESGQSGQGGDSGEALAEAKYRAAVEAVREGNSRRAVELASEAVAADAKLADAWYLRGRENFRLGKVRQSVEDFDRFVALRPALASRQWERGIACYYAGKFKEGAEQFALYQTYHDNDVENSVWRFLCMARTDGFEKARKAMLPIKDDRRIPMMEIYRMFAGQSEPEDVLEAVGQGDPPAEVLAGRKFYAQLYLGLYYEVKGDAERAARYIRAAAEEHRQTRTVNRYMWDVARIHAQQLSSAE